MQDKPSAPLNAVRALVGQLPRQSVRRILGDLGHPRAARDAAVLRKTLASALELDLVGLLNQMQASELKSAAKEMGESVAGSAGQLRARLWLHGARLEALGDDHLSRPWQPVPSLFRGKLVHFGPERGLSPESAERPRSVPASRRIRPRGEPDNLEELLARATELVGVRLGARGRDKGAFGNAVAALLGLGASNHAEPDWRGEVEVKSVPVAREEQGLWFVKEDPAISMEGAQPLAKLERVLWMARVSDEDDSPVLSWYYQELDAVTRPMARHYLHTRPKGPAGTDRRGWYLHKRFFVESGFLKSLNG